MIRRRKASPSTSHTYTAQCQIGFVEHRSKQAPPRACNRQVREALLREGVDVFAFDGSLIRRMEQQDRQEYKHP